MKENAGARIPTFKTHESKQVKGSYDFIGIIHYTKFNVSDNSDALNTKLRDFSADTGANLLVSARNHVYDLLNNWWSKLNHSLVFHDFAAVQDILAVEEYLMAPSALQEVLETFKTLYGNPHMFIYENGQWTASNASLHDVSRVE
ncbi:hypothetical protein RYX36_020295 [Vicia faba]